MEKILRDFDSEECVREGMESLLYVNAYAVTRHFGGREEGGWYYNRFSPLASIPVKAIVRKGHTSICMNCSKAHGSEDYCEDSFHLEPVDYSQVEQFSKHLKEMFADVVDGDIYSVNGGVDLNVCIEVNQAELEPKEKPRYE